MFRKDWEGLSRQGRKKEASTAPGYLKRWVTKHVSRKAGEKWSDSGDLLILWIRGMKPRKKTKMLVKLLA